MITEDYVSFEVAKLLKEKGMDKSCFNHYIQKNNNDGTSEAVTVCTLQIAMKWLREEKRTAIIIVFDVTGRGFCPYVYQLDYDMDWVVNWRINIPMKYEEAVETALKYSLENLILL